MKRMIFSMALLFVFQTNSDAQVANRYDIVIDELMADPTPQVGLPNNEWIELRNVSTITFNLSGWKIGDAISQSGVMPAYNLKPDSFVIVCTSSAVAAMSAFGPAISVTTFPSLDNAGDVIFLRSPQNKIIHAVSYTDKWYQNELKAGGGWTLEMIDTRNPCTGSANWKASTDNKGGTPGKINSVNGINADKDPPSLLRAYAKDSASIVLVFDEPLDSSKAALVANYVISDGIGIPKTATVNSPIFDRVSLILNIPLQRDKIYTITANAITDCAGNIIGTNKTTRVGLSSRADSLDVVINEILFNPKANGVDYVEIYNRSKKIIDLKNISIANRNTAGAVSSISQVSAEEDLFFPSAFMVITSDPSVVKRDYVAPDTTAFAEIGSMPSYNDDEGDVVILNDQGSIVDELKYSAKWHFKLISDPEGVALERIDYNAPTQLESNWHSAATSVGYGTPTYKNSQYHSDEGLKREITITPEIVSPDNDGMDDFATIDYVFPSPGYVVNITIFDANGRVVRYLQRNALCGIKGNYRWDGLGEKDQKLPVGIYIFYTEVFNLEGKKKEFKNTIVLARRQ